MSVNKRKIHFIRPDQQYDFTVPSGTTFYENHRIATAVSTLKVVLPRALSQLDHTGMMVKFFFNVLRIYILSKVKDIITKTNCKRSE